MLTFLPRTQELDLSDNPIGDAPGLAGLAAAPLPRLSKLFLADTGLTPAGMAALDAAPWVAQLSELDLRQAAAAAAEFEDSDDECEWDGCSDEEGPSGRLELLGAFKAAPALLEAQRQRCWVRRDF